MPLRRSFFRRFGKLWLSTPVLDLDNCLYHVLEDDDGVIECDNEKFMDVIYQVWNHRDDVRLDKLRLNRLNLLFTLLNEPDFNEAFYHDHPESIAYEKRALEEVKAAAEQIDKLIGYAISRKVKILDLNFRGCDKWVAYRTKFYELPDVFSSNCLTSLRLTGCDIGSPGEN